MYARRKIQQGRQQETTNDGWIDLPRIDLNKQPVQSNMTEKNNKIEKEAVDIIIAPAENIKYRHQFNDQVIFKVVPERMERIEKTGIAIWVR